MRLYSMLLGLLFTSVLTGQEYFVRYNYAGYKTLGKKSLIINSTYSISSKPWTISMGDSILLNGLIKKSITGKGDHTNFPFNYKVDFSSIKQNGLLKFNFEEKSYHLNINPDPYSKYIKEVLRYLRQQRSGSHESIDRAPGHFRDSAALVYRQVDEKKEWKKTPTKVNVSGGWYDAGDYLKFSLTNAYTCYQLLRAYEENPSIFNYKIYSKSQFNDLLDEVKFGLDFLEKCYVNDSTFVFQIGDNRDHELGNRLPVNDTNLYRFAYTSLSRSHMAFASASFAVASRVFSSVDSTQAKIYLQKSEELFEMSLKHKGVYWYEKNHEVFYADKSPFDNMLLSASELAITTGKKYYEEQIQYFSSLAGKGYWASWSDFNMIAHSRAGIYYSRSSNYLISELEYFEKKATEISNIWMVPHDYTWGSLYSFFGVASASILHDNLLKKNAFGYLAQEVIDYTFGKNNWGTSFLASKNIPNSVKNIYSQTYKIQKNLFPTGAIAEGPGDMEGHLSNVKWFSLSEESFESEKFNTQKVVFFDDDTDFQTMETTICGIADGIFLLSLISK